MLASSCSSPAKQEHLFDLSDGRHLRTLRDSVELAGGQFDSAGELLVTFGRKTRIWDVKSGRRLQTLSTATDVTAVDFSSDGKLLLTTEGRARARSRCRRLWDVSSGQPLPDIPVMVTSADLSAGGQQVVTASMDGTVRVWNSKSGESTTIFRNVIDPRAIRRTETLFRARWGPRDDMLLTVGNGAVVETWRAVSARGNAVSSFAEGKMEFRIGGSGIESRDFIRVGATKPRTSPTETSTIWPTPSSPDGRFVAYGLGVLEVYVRPRHRFSSSVAPGAGGPLSITVPTGGLSLT